MLSTNNPKSREEQHFAFRPVYSAYLLHDYILHVGLSTEDRIDTDLLFVGEGIDKSLASPTVWVVQSPTPPSPGDTPPRKDTSTRYTITYRYHSATILETSLVHIR